LGELKIILEPGKTMRQTRVDHHVLVTNKYYEFLPLFDEVIARKVATYRSSDHKIPLKDGFVVPLGSLYGLSRNELASEKEYIKKNLDRGSIRVFSLPDAALVIFIMKSDGSLRQCVDYRRLNNCTIKNRYLLLIIQETLGYLQKAHYYPTLDIHDAYFIIWIAYGEKWKTVFRTRYGLFEYLVMQYGFTNAL
jgi:hypothetical protein